LKALFCDLCVIWSSACIPTVTPALLHISSAWCDWFKVHLHSNFGSPSNGTALRHIWVKLIESFIYYSTKTAKDHVHIRVYRKKMVPHIRNLRLMLRCFYQKTIVLKQRIGIFSAAALPAHAQCRRCCDILV